MPRLAQTNLIGRFVAFYAALRVSMPKDLEAGYVLIVTRQAAKQHGGIFSNEHELS